MTYICNSPFDLQIKRFRKLSAGNGAARMGIQAQMQTLVEVCDISAQYLNQAYNKLLPLFPMDEERFDRLSRVELSFLDQLVYRFSKLQDALGAKLFPMLVGLLQQDVDKLTFIDILNRLEKAELLPSAREWQQMRDFRNHLTHEYPSNPELKISNLNASVKYVNELLTYWQTLRVKVLNMKGQLG
jgi:hypothetical protein